MNNTSILVNSSDSFEDCWVPFFILFDKYWPNCGMPVYLNTERKSFEWKGTTVISTRANSGVERRLTWSECLRKALEKMDTPFVLYLQEDYFFESPVDTAQIHQFEQLMIRNPEIARIDLTCYGGADFVDPTSSDLLCRVRNYSRYAIHTQAAIWRRDVLLSFIEDAENGWKFELLGSLRAIGRKEMFLTLNREKFNDRNAVIFYTHTGIIKGRWNEAIVSLFEANDIRIDFTRRGFYTRIHQFAGKITLLRKMAGNPEGLAALLKFRIKNFFRLLQPGPKSFVELR